MEDAVIVSAVRTPVGSFGGQFKDIAATELGAHAVRAALERAEIAGEEVDEVVLGCVLQAGLGQNPARQAAIGAGIPKEVPATTINMVCGSGLKSVAIASQMVRAGDVDVVVAGGMENMTRAPYLIPSGRLGARMGDAQLIDSMVHDGLWDAFNDIHMGITAENLAEQYGISREEQDEFAASSQQKAERAVAAGIFKDEIVPIEVPVKGSTRVVDSDEHPRAGTTAETLGKLPAAFRGVGSMQFATLMVEKSGVVVSPGVAFGEHGEGYVRIAMVENEQRIRQAARGVRRFLESGIETLHNVVPLANRR